MANIDIDIELLEANMTIDFTIDDGGSGGGELPPYTGAYKITPKISEQVFPTKNKSMLDDVTVYQIPYKSVSNPEGGTTVTIGFE